MRKLPSHDRMLDYVSHFKDLEERRVIRELLRSEALITDIEMTEAGELWVAYRGLTKADPPGIRIFRVTDGAELTVRVQGDGVVPAPVAIGHRRQAACSTRSVARPGSRRRRWWRRKRQRRRRRHRRR